MSKIIKCPAKINLFLKITGKDENGYHNLESLFALIDLFDELEVTPHNHFELILKGKNTEFIDPKNNLFTQILDYFCQEFDINKNLKITLNKNIPVGGGLGGGSSNAAYFMMALNEIFCLNLSKEKLQKISLNFGSDIAFFFEKTAAIVKGRGQIISQYSTLKPFNILLINPQKHISTKEVFKKFNNNFSNKTSTSILLNEPLENLLKITNDLEKPAKEIEPKITQILTSLKKENAQIAKMSGSGSTCFGIFANDKILEKAYHNLKKQFPNFLINKQIILNKR